MEKKSPIAPGEKNLRESKKANTQTTLAPYSVDVSSLSVCLSVRVTFLTLIVYANYFLQQN